MAFQTLEIARSALTAARAALDLTSQNVANANTPGYVRQRVVLAPLSAADPRSTEAAGGGVTVAGVERLRDQALEAQLNHQQGQLGRERAQAQSLLRVQNYFPDLSDAGISAALTSTFDALAQLQTQPDSVAARQGVIDNADAFCQELKGAVAQLQQERATLEADLEQQVSQINLVLRQVGELNGKIAALGNNPGANDLKVAREQAINQLSGLCGASGLDQPHNGQDVLLGGIRLVQGTEVHELSLVPDPANPVNHLVAIGTIVSPSALGGVLAGDIQARDTNLKQWEGDLNQLAQTLADAFNTQHRAGVDLNNNAGQDFFTYVPGMAASSLRVSQAIKDSPSLLAAASAIGGPPGDGTNAAALANLRSAKIMAGGTQTAGDFQAGLLSSIGSETRRTNEAADARDGLLTSLQTQYTNAAGVSLDEEAVDVLRFQQMYQSAAKMVQVASSMMDQLLQAVG